MKNKEKRARRKTAGRGSGSDFENLNITALKTPLVSVYDDPIETGGGGGGTPTYSPPTYSPDQFTKETDLKNTVTSCRGNADIIMIGNVISHGYRTQTFSVGAFVYPYYVYGLGGVGPGVEVVALQGDTNYSIAQKLANKINQITLSEWNDYGHAQMYNKPNATASGEKVVVYLEYQNEFWPYAQGSCPTVQEETYYNPPYSESEIDSMDCGTLQKAMGSVYNQMQSSNASAMTFFSPKKGDLSFTGGTDKQAVYSQVYQYMQNRYNQVCNKPIEPPVVSVNPISNITLPSSGVYLEGSASDPQNQSLSYLWTMVEGPGGAIQNQNSPVATFTNLQPGNYTFKLTAVNQSGVSGSQTVSFTVNPAPPKEPPTVSIAPVDSITLPQNNVSIQGSASDPQGEQLSYQWSVVHADNDANATGINTPTLNLSLLQAGNYTLRLTATNQSGKSASADVSFTVNPEPPKQPPTVSVSPVNNITLPNNQVQLSGSASDPQGQSLSYKWDIQGPGGSIQGGNTASAIVSDLQAGNYSARLTVTNQSGLSSYADVSWTVNPAPAPPPMQPEPSPAPVTPPPPSVVEPGPIEGPTQPAPQEPAPEPQQPASQPQEPAAPEQPAPQQQEPAPQPEQEPPLPEPYYEPPYSEAQIDAMDCNQLQAAIQQVQSQMTMPFTGNPAHLNFQGSTDKNAVYTAVYNYMLQKQNNSCNLSPDTVSPTAPTEPAPSVQTITPPTIVPYPVPFYPIPKGPAIGGGSSQSAQPLEDDKKKYRTWFWLGTACAVAIAYALKSE